MKTPIRLALALLLGSAGCFAHKAVPCGDNHDCDLQANGECLASATGNMWCAYPDSACTSGFRYSSQDGDGLAGTCTMSESADAGVDAMPDAPRSWSAPALLTNVNSTADERFPAVSANGLELFFSRLSLNAPYGEIYVARRSSTTQPFGAPAAVSEVNGSTTNEIFAVPAHSGLELFMSEAGQIMRYTRPNAATSWSGAVYTGIDANFISLSADDLTMYVVKRCPQNVNGGSGPCWYYATRQTIGGTWSTLTNVAFDGNSQWNGADTSGDGLHLLVSGPYSGSGIPIAEQRRASTADPWSNTQVISPLDLESTNTDARWNAGRTEVYLAARPAGNASTGYDIYVSVLQ